MDANRKRWNDNHRILQQKLPKALDFEAAKALLLNHHAMIHSAGVGKADQHSFEDEMWDGMTEADARRIPRGQEHSLVWIMWHLARVEDVTMNMLVTGYPQVIHDDHWLERMNAPFQDTGNAITGAQMQHLNAYIDVAGLRAYRQAVGHRTQDIIHGLQADTLRQKVSAARIQKLRDSGMVVAAASEIIDYWSKRTIAGLLLMPATRHNFLHLNEGQRIKQALRKTA